MTADRYRRSEDVAFRQIGDECLLVPIRKSPKAEMAVFSLNGVGAFVWEALGEPRSLEELGAKVSAAFEVTPADAKRDVEAFVSRLLAKGLAQVEA